MKIGIIVGRWLFIFEKVEISGISTSNLKALKNMDIVALLKRVKLGDKQAREELIAGNLRLVLSTIHKFANRSENMDDLFQIGCIGLIKAIDNFDISLGLRFSTYGVPMIIGEIRRYLRDNRTVRVSRSIQDLAYKALQIKETILSKTQKDPTMDEIASVLGVKRENVVFALDAISTPVSLSEPINNDADDNMCMMDQVRDTNNTDEYWLEQIALKDAMSKLGEREKNILSMRYFAGKTQMEVATEVGISQAQVSRLENLAMKKIKQNLL